MALSVKDATKVTQTLKTSLSGSDHVPHHNVDTLPALAAGTNVIGKVLVSTATTGGYSVYRNIDLAETGVSVKGSAGQVYGWYIANTSQGWRYVKLYSKATAPTVGTDTPTLTIPIPAGAAANVEFSVGVPFALGIGIGCTTGVADADTGAPDTNDLICNLLYA